MAKQLTFDEFRAANVARYLKWHPNGIDSWSPSDWLTAVTEELGELASLLKMRNRERDGLRGNKFSPSDKQVADELADVLTYLDLLAAVLGVDLGRAAAEKFNDVSARVGFPDRINLEHFKGWQMTDREMLELAAKAAGYDFGLINDKPKAHIVEDFGTCGTYGCAKHQWRDWNPLTDDGDNARQEAVLDIDVAWYPLIIRASNWRRVLYVFEQYADHGGDKNKARRYASTKLAAEIGKGMK